MPVLNLSSLPKLGNKKQAVFQNDEFNGGVNLQYSETRLKKNEAKEALNLMLIEDGIWDKRWGTKTLITMADDIDGFTEYVKSDGTTELIIVAGGNVYKSTDLSTTSQITGATLTAGYDCFFVQINNFLYIGNGKDALVRYNGTTLAQYSALGTMGTVTPSRVTLTAGSYNVYYKVTATNAVGENAPSAEATITVNKDRDSWATGDGVKLDWSAVVGALKYTIYYADTSGYEVKLAEVTTNTFTDDGTLVPNPYIAPPAADTSAGPKLKHMWINGNRIWGTEPDNPWRAYFSGSGVYLGNFATAFGGGWIDLEKGGRSMVDSGADYQGKTHVICRTPDGRGNIWQITLESQSVSGTSTSYIVPVPVKIIGSVGSNAPRSVIYVENDVWFGNKNAIDILGNEPGVLNVLRTNELSGKVRPYIQSLDGASISKMCMYYYDAKVFISVATTTGDPDRTLVFDRERLAWIKDWSVGFTQFGQMTDSANKTHFLGSSAKKIKEISPSYEDDDGVAFSWKFVSGRIPVDKDWTRFGKIKRAYIRLRNTTGSVQFSFAGTSKNKSITQVATGTITSGSSDSGMGWDLMGSVQMGDSAGVPTVFAEESLIRYLRINKLIRDQQWTVQGTGIRDRAVITGLMSKGYLVATGEPADWRL